VGSVALDSVETPFGRRDDVLGGSATYFSSAASFLTDVGIVAVVGEDFPAEHLEYLKARGVRLGGLQRTQGATFRWKGRYGFDLNNAETLDTRLNVFEKFTPDLPAACRAAEFVFLGNIDPELQIRVLEQVERPRLVACDTMNFWIRGKPDALRRALKRVDLLLVNDAEARQLAGENNIVKAARAIQAMGPRRLVIKRGEYGAILFEGEHAFAAPAYPLHSLFDPTGAGDSFAGGFVGHLARMGTLDGTVVRQATIMGSVLASFCVEAFSVDRFRSLTREEIAARFREFKHLTHFDDLPAGFTG
jgi:sugar/nucleoside kinase (ribokinase family)